MGKKKTPPHHHHHLLISSYVCMYVYCLSVCLPLFAFFLVSPPRSNKRGGKEKGLVGMCIGEENQLTYCWPKGS